MTSPHIEKLPKPKKAFRNLHPEFETRKRACREDRKRVKSIRDTIGDGDFQDFAEPHQLRLLIDRIVHARCPASAVYMRQQRKRLIGHLWELCAAFPDARFFTVVPPQWRFPAGELERVDPNKLTESLRITLLRCGAKSDKGWLFAFIDGEYDALSQEYHLHVHGVAWGKMLKAVDKLRKRRSLKSVRGLTVRSVVNQVVQVKRQPLINMPSPLGYLVKSYWNQRSLFDDGVGNIKLGRFKGRISDPHQVEVLLWMDRWSMKDRALLMGMRATRKGLILPKKCTLR